MKTETMWLSKYALSSGIREIAATVISDGFVRDGRGSYYFVGSECFPTREDAVADAEKRRAKRIASMKEQIAKLEALTFTAEGA